MQANKKQADAAFLVCLILSTLGPSSAYRMHGHHQDDLDEGGSNSKADGQRWWGTISCPAGLEPNDTSKLCSYPDTSWRYSTYAMGAMGGAPIPLIFTTYSKSKLLFNHTTGGTFLTSSQFTAELAAAFTDKKAMYKVGNSLAQEEMKRNETFAKLVSEQSAEEHSGFHQLEENLKPGFFVVEHAVEHAVVEGLEIGFHALAHAADHGVVFGEEFLLHAFGVELAEVALGTAGVAAFVLEWVFPVLLPLQAGVMVWQVRSHFKERTHHAKNFTSHLVLKSECMITTLENALELGQLQPIVGEVCGNGFHGDLQRQLFATGRAKLRLFNTLADLGRCLYPHGDRAWSKINCVESMYYKLLQSKGQAGMLYGILSFMAYYGFRLDELATKPFFEKWYQEEFGIQKEANTVSLMPELVKVKDQGIAERWPVCMQMMSTHRAFERTFQRMNAALKIWMRILGVMSVVLAFETPGGHARRSSTSWLATTRISPFASTLIGSRATAWTKNLLMRVSHAPKAKSLRDHCGLRQRTRTTSSEPS